MVRLTATTRVVSFFLLAACGALCQGEPPSADVLSRDGPISPEVPRQAVRTWESLPDAPSLQPPTQAERSQTFVDGVRSPLTVGSVAINAGAMRETELGHLGHITSGQQTSFSAPRTAVSTQNNSSVFFDKYFYPSLLKQNLHYHASNSISFRGRVTYAASRIFITRDDSGKGRLNTSYFLGVLTSLAIQTAHRPYWARSSSATFNQFGSTIGSDAGINLLHEFEPGMRQMVKDHAPNFVSRIEERITHDQSPSVVVYTPAR
jgi:hypothetical protein